MLQITPQQTIMVAVQPVDFRKGIDGLAALCRIKLKQDPFSGALFVFTNRHRTSVKIIVYDGQGYWLCMKRFSKGKLAWWPTESGSCTCELLASQLQILLYQGSPQGAKIPEDWRSLKRPKQETDDTFAPIFPALIDTSRATNLQEFSQQPLHDFARQSNNGKDSPHSYGTSQ
jgi:transposase